MPGVTLLLSADLAWGCDLARTWAGDGDAVTVVLLDAAAAAARAGSAGAEAVAGLLAAGVAVAAHDDALCRRAIAGDRLLDGVKVVDLDEVADLALEGTARVVWL